MQDSLGRNITYLRISVTDRCNLRCRYCMPRGGVELTDHREILSLEEMSRLVNVGSELGISRVRITGGEPLVRRGLLQLVKDIAANSSIKDLSLTTNGTHLARMAPDLKAAGLQRVNISLDTIDPEKYRYITGGGELQPVLDAIKISLEIGFSPVKINTVLIKDFNDTEVDQFVSWAIKEPVHIRFIEFMPVGDLEFWDHSRWIPSEDILERLVKQYQLEPTDKLVGAGPASVYRPAGGKGTIGFITPLSNHFCHDCNRLRLTAQGMLLGCLHGSEGVDLKGPMREGASDTELKQLFLQAVAMKPRGHHLQQGWGKESTMSQIGG